MSAFLRASAVRSGNFDIQVWWKGADGTHLSPSSGSNFAPVAGQWVRVSATFTVPAGAYRMCFVIDFDGSTPVWQAGDTLDSTGLMVTSGSTLYNYADGNTPGWTWTGTPNASTSARIRR